MVCVLIILSRHFARVIVTPQNFHGLGFLREVYLSVYIFVHELHRAGVFDAICHLVMFLEIHLDCLIQQMMIFVNSAILRIAAFLYEMRLSTRFEELEPRFHLLYFIFIFVLDIRYVSKLLN